MPAPHLSWLISLPHALSIAKKLRQKRHRDAGFWYELEDVDQREARRQPEACFYSEYTPSTIVYRMNIFYEKPDEAQPDKSRVPRGVARK